MVVEGRRREFQSFPEFADPTAAARLAGPAIGCDVRDQPAALE